MEHKYPCLWYCEDHWKAHHVAQMIYSQWYWLYHKNMQAAKVKEEHAKKRKRIAIEDVNDMDTTSPGLDADRMDDTIDPGLNADGMNDTIDSTLLNTSEDT